MTGCARSTLDGVHPTCTGTLLLHTRNTYHSMHASWPERCIHLRYVFLQQARPMVHTLMNLTNRRLLMNLSNRLLQPLAASWPSPSWVVLGLASPLLPHISSLVASCIGCSPYDGSWHTQPSSPHLQAHQGRIWARRFRPVRCREWILSWQRERQGVMCNGSIPISQGCDWHRFPLTHTDGITCYWCKVNPANSNCFWPGWVVARTSENKYWLQAGHDHNASKMLLSRRPGHYFTYRVVVKQC